MGPGTDRLNVYTVRMATQGLANYLLSVKKGGSVIIGYDSRNNSRLFAENTAQVLAANGIRALLFKDIRPVPFVSFGKRFKKCDAGVMITASHNAAAYNGYKVYWSDGAQVVAPHDEGIIEEVRKVEIQDVKMAPLTHALVETVDESFDNDYLAAINPLKFFPDEGKETLKITYSSLHGTGIKVVPKALASWGYSNINFVEKQIVVDGNFPTVAVPNPEFKETLALGMEQLEKTGSDILIETDPDADRIAVVPRHQGKSIILNGNEIASICVEFLCTHLKEEAKGAFITTIVSTDLIATIAKAHSKTCFEVLTGFKYIGEMIHKWETSNDGYHFIFGAEESYGFLLGTHARDKDAVVTSCLMSEIAFMAKKDGKTLIDLLHEIYRRYGVFREKQLSLNFKPGMEGSEQIKNIMANLRKNLPKTFCGKEVLVIEDYLSGTRHLLKDNKKEKLTLPKSDVLLFRLSDKTKLIIRPSGTEPKIKVYAGVQERIFSSIDEGIANCDNRLDKILLEVKNELNRP